MVFSYFSVLFLLTSAQCELAQDHCGLGLGQWGFPFKVPVLKYKLKESIAHIATQQM